MLGSPRSRTAERTRDALGEQGGVVEKKMFGGLAFLLHGHMCCGVVGDDLMVRVGAEEHESALARPHARPMDFTGKPLKGMVYVSHTGLRTEKSLRAWIDRGVRYVSTLPPKQPPARRTRRPKRS